MREWIGGLVFCALVAVPSAASGLSLGHDDLIALGTGQFGDGIYRVDSGTGGQDLIAAGSFSDFAVRGAHRIYATDGGKVVEIDPESGDSRVIASGFSGSLSVTVNRTGDVFVMENESGVAPRLHLVDPESGTSRLLLTSGLSSLFPGGDPSLPGISYVADLELLDEDTPIVLAEGRAFGVDSSGGVVAFDRWTAGEEILVSNTDAMSVLGPNGFEGGWTAPTGLGVTADGKVLVACDGDYDCGLWSYDPKIDILVALGVEDVFGTGLYGSVDWSGVDIAALSNGELFIATGGARSGGDQALAGIHPLLAGACPICAPGSDLAAILLDGDAFSQGNWREIQVVDAVTPIPEPNAFLVFALGIAFVSSRAKLG